jgi:GWxTD domain-containing protein
MKRKLILLISFCVLTLYSRAINVLVTHANFQQGDAAYVEVYFNIVGQSVAYQMKPDTAHLQANVEILLLIKQGEKIIVADKYNLQSPVVNQPSDFFDIKRYALTDGTYELETQVNDLNRVGVPALQKQTISILFEKNKIHQSDIQLLKSIKKDSSNSAYSKNGFLMEPIAGNFYDKNTSTLYFYQEIYQTTEDFALSYGIYNSDLHASKIPFAVAHKRLRPSPNPVPFIGQVDISKLASGNYTLLVEIRNRNKELLCQKELNFQRSNPYLNVETQGISKEAIEEEFVAKMTPERLKYSLRAIACKMRGDESKDLNEIIKLADPQAMKLRLFRYWATKDANHPEEAYNNYMAVAQFVDEKYRSGFGYGFESDRGYVYMKYGRPDDIVEQPNNPDAVPYEIWVYYDFPITGQKNIKFMFFDNDATGNMRILNSNARGELQDPNWRTKLYKHARNQWEGDGFGPTRVQDNVGRNADKLLEDW